MKMWRPDQRVVGPRRATLADVGVLNRIFSDAFTDRYRRDGLVGVRVPQLNPKIWSYALEDAGEGAMLWLDEDDDIVAFNIAHHSGVEGWMGPLAVRPDRQGLGLGKAVVETAIDWLRDQGVRTLGLETMPRTVENIGFYSRLGFTPGHLTVTLTGEIGSRGGRAHYTRLSALSEAERSAVLERCRERLQRSVPGYDYTREHEITTELGIGDTVVIGDQTVQGFALWHSAALADSRPSDELRVLKLFADSPSSFARLVVALEGCAAGLRLRRVAIRCQSSYEEVYHGLIAKGYRVRWTDLRMTLEAHPEPVAPEGEILLSNWEI